MCIVKYILALNRQLFTGIVDWQQSKYRTPERKKYRTIPTEHCNILVFRPISPVFFVPLRP